MDKFVSFTGVGVPLRRSNVDTDQIIPAVYLKRVTRTGFDDALFAAWRRDDEFVLNKPEFSRGSVLVAGLDFGTDADNAVLLSHEIEAWDIGGAEQLGGLRATSCDERDDDRVYL